MSASFPRRVDSPSLHEGIQSQPIESGAKRKRVSQEHIDALIIKAKEDWEKDAKRRVSENSQTQFSQEQISEAPLIRPESQHQDTQKSSRTASSLSSETISYCERLKQKMKEAMEQRQDAEVATINQRWKMSVESITNPNCS
ncbi:MAG: hypothetical protein KF898_09270 [Parachlamydiales bacterium]|nr:hypothetical protein [Candidatus Acheromyda pituitae]